MSLPWEEYQSASAPTGDSKPWEQYAPADQGPWNDYPKRPTEDFSAAHAAARWQTAANLADTLSKYVAQPLSDIPGTALDAMENASIALGLSKRTSTPLSEQVKQTVRETAGNIGENIAHALNYTTAPELAAGRGVGEAVGELAQPQNLITLPALAGGGAVARGALAAITMQAAHAIPEQASEAGAASVEGTPEEKGKAFTGLGLSTLMVAAPLTYTALTEAPSRMPMEKMKLPGFEGLGIPQEHAPVPPEHAPVPPEPAVAPKVPPISGPVATETAPTETAIDPEAVPKTELAPQSIKLSPDVPSFKLNADPVTGVAPGTKIEGPITTPITVWQRLNGDMEVVTGRGRLQTAKDRGDATIPVQIVKESDGFNKDQAITLDAEANIHDNTGRVEDTSAYFRNSPQLSRADAESRGLLSSPENEAAWDLGRNATPDVYSQFQSGQINQSEALAAARATTGGEPAAPAGSVPTVSDGAAAPSGAGADDGAQRINLAAETSPTGAAMEAERPPTASTPLSDGGDLFSPKGPGLVGMGGATPSEFGNREDITSNMFAAIDRDRADRGLPPMERVPRQGWDEANKRGLEAIRSVPNWADDLIAEVTAKPRSLEPWENAGLVWTRDFWKSEVNNSIRAEDQARRDGRSEDVVAERQLRAAFEDKLDALDKAVGKGGTGTQAGLALQAQKMGTGDDWTLAEMRLQKRASVGYRPLTDAESKEISDLHQKIQETQAAYDAHVKAADEKLAAAEADKKIAELKAEQATKLDPVVKRILDRVGQTLHSQRDAARARLAGKLFTISPDVLKDLSIIGASHIYDGAVGVAEWSAKMISDIGERVRPHLDEIFKASNDLFDKTADAAAGKREPRVKAAVKTAADLGNDAQVAIAAKVNAGKRGEIAMQVQKLARSFVSRGVESRDELIDKVHNVLKDIIPDITRRQTMDAISGYGEFKQLKKDEVSVALRGLKGEMQQVAKIEDIESRSPPLKTGVERRTPTDEERRLIKQVNEAKRKYGVVVTDPETQLKSVLQSRKTYYENRINDLRSEITARQQVVKTKTPSPTDPALEALKKEYETVKAEHDAIFQKPGLTDAQKLKMAIAGAERQSEQWAKKLEDAKKGVYEQPSSPKLTSPELEAVRARNEAVKNQVQELKDADAQYQEKLRADDIQNSIDEYERRTKAGEFTAAAATKATTPALDALIAKRDAAREAFAAAKAASPAEQARKIADAETSAKALGDELERRINEGDIAARKGNVGASSPELEKQRAENNELQNILRRMQNAAKPKKTPEQIALQTLKTRLANSTADYQERLADGNFSTSPRRQITLDTDALRAKADNERAKLAFQRGKAADELTNRSRTEKIFEQVSGAARASALSGYHTLGKLAAYTAAKLIEKPITAVVGEGLQRLPGVRGVAARSRFEAGPQVKALADFYVGFAKRGMAEAAQQLKTGEADIRAAYGKPKLTSPQWFDFFGNLHAAEKTPLLTGSFEQYLRHLTEWAISKGLDPSKPIVQGALRKAAYTWANRDILQENNKFANWINMGIKSMYAKEKITDPITGETTKLESIPRAAIATALESFLTKGIVKTPANYFMQSMERTPAGLALGAGKLAHAIYNGTSKLSPHEADVTMRLLKVGSVGSAMFIWGMIDATKPAGSRLFGGYYQPGQARNDADAKFGTIRIPGVPNSYWTHILTHNPMTESAQMGSTFMRVIRSSLGQQQGDRGSLAGAIGAMSGLLENAPIAGSAQRLTEIGDPRQQDRRVGELFRSLIPQLVQNIAEDTDDDSWRTPHTIGQSLQMGIPGLRQQVPIHSFKSVGEALQDARSKARAQ